MAIFRQKSLDKLSSPEQLDKLIVITSPMTWLTLIGAALIVGTTITWSIVSKIPTTLPATGLYTKANSNSAQTVFYIPFTQAKTVEKGMPINIYFTALPKETYGHVEGEVVSVGNKPVTGQEMAKQLGDATLASYYMTQAQGAPLVEVIGKAKKDSKTVSGLDWSTQKGSKAKVSKNMELTADIVVSEVTPLSKVVPSLG